MTKNALEIFKQRAAKNPELQKAYEREKEAYYAEFVFKPPQEDKEFVYTKFPWLDEFWVTQIPENHIQDATKKVD